MACRERNLLVFGILASGTESESRFLSQDIGSSLTSDFTLRSISLKVKIRYASRKPDRNAPVT